MGSHPRVPGMSDLSQDLSSFCLCSTRPEPGTSRVRGCLWGARSVPRALGGSHRVHMHTQIFQSQNWAAPTFSPAGWLVQGANLSWVWIKVGNHRLPPVVCREGQRTGCKSRSKGKTSGYAASWWRKIFLEQSPLTPLSSRLLCREIILSAYAFRQFSEE